MKMEQKYSSKNTSINKSKLPAIYSKINWEKIAEEWQKKSNTKPIVLDYGCGRYTDHIRKYMESLGYEYVGYDPYWYRETDINNCSPTVVICSNVLNVVKEDNIVKDIISKITKYNVPCFISIYEGNKSGIGQPTSPSTYQRNERTKEYLRFMNALAQVKKNVVVSNAAYASYIK